MTIIKVGDVKDELLGIVKDEKIDLVVMGTNGRNAFERLFLGSVTERLLRHLPVPVLTVSHLDRSMELHGTEPVPMRKILCATDLSTGAEAGLKFSLDLARRTGASVTLLHAVSPMQGMYWSDMGTYLENDLDEIRREALTRLKLSIPEAESQGVDVIPIMREGDAFREILRIASEDRMNLIVLSLEPKTMVERAVLGATAERVVRSAHVPVLSIPVPAAVVTGNREATATAA
jgi:nucleotide-binding universal stress UspA family protein